MRCRTYWIMLLGLGITLACAAPSTGQIKLFRKAQPEEGLELTQSQGPWLIMCASFVGEPGEQQARRLAEELRSDYNLDAYLYRHSFNYSDKIQALGWDPPSDQTGLPVPKQLKAAHADKFEEIAVVVGNFPSLTDSNAQKNLELVKHLQPRALEIKEYVSTSQRMGVLRKIHRSISSDPKAHEKGPMGSAFLMPNPLLPEEYFQTKTLDSILIKLNKGVRYSLLDCPGQYSVKVATFRGDQTFNDKEIVKKQREYEDLLSSGKPLTESKLAEAGVKAHLLCSALRKKGVEAWEFHDHNESYVCVGSFDWATRPVELGPDQLNPEVAAVIQQYKAVDTAVNGSRQFRPRTIALLKGTNINFDAQPLPVRVPEVSASKRRGLFGGN